MGFVYFLQAIWNALLVLIYVCWIPVVVVVGVALLARLAGKISRSTKKK